MGKRKVSVKVIVLSVMWPVLLLGLSCIYMDTKRAMVASLNVALKEFPEYSILVDEEKGYILAC